MWPEQLTSSEGKTCEKEDLCREVVKKLGKIEKKWAVALTSEQCNLLDDCEKSQLRDWSKSIGGGGGGWAGAFGNVVVKNT